MWCLAIVIHAERGIRCPFSENATEGPISLDGLPGSTDGHYILPDLGEEVGQEYDSSGQGLLGFLVAGWV